MSGLVLNSTEFIDAIAFVEQACGRSAIDSLNRASLHVIIGSGSYPGAMQLTPKADRAKIDAVSDQQIRGYVVAKAKRTGHWPMTRLAIEVATRKERRRRRSAIGYAAFAGWSKAAKALGGAGVRGVKDGFALSEAAHGSGRKATVIFPESIGINTAPAAERIGFEALQQGMDNAAKDLVDYGSMRLQKIYDKVKP